MAWKALFGKPASRDNGQGSSLVQSELLLDPRALLQAHRAELNALRLECGYGVSQFRLLFEAPVLQVAHWVHCLPATAAAHHSESGGLLRLSIECAVVALRRSDGKFFADAGDATRRDNDRERLLRYLAFLGGLLRPIGNCATQVQLDVPSVLPGWNPLSEGLWPWRCRGDLGTLKLRWSEDIDDIALRDRASVWIASRLLPPEVFLHLHKADRSLPTKLLSIVGGERGTVLATAVEDAYQAVIELDLSRRKHQIQPQQVSVPIEHQLMDAMRMLCREKWQVNAPGAVVWCTNEGVFLDWKLACADVSIRLRAAGLINVPQDPDTIAELLLTQQVLVANAEASSGLRHLYRIDVQARGVPQRSLYAVRIAEPERIGLHLEGVDQIPAEIESPRVGVVIERPPLNGASSPQSASMHQADPVLTGLNVPDRSSHSSEVPTVPSQWSPSSRPESPLRRFGTVGVALQRLADLMSSQSSGLTLARTEEGLAVSYPDSVALFSPKPEEFVTACEAQGLLVPERAGGRKFVRTAPIGRDDLPRQYIVLAPRVLKYLGPAHQTS